MAKFFPIVALGVVALLAVSQAMPQFGSSSEESAETGEFMREIQEMCRNNSGSDDAFGMLMIQSQSSMMCVMKSFDFESFIAEVDTLSNETRTTFFSRYCPQLRTASGCLDKLVDASKPCFEDDDFTIVKAIGGIVPDAIELVCKDNGEIVFKLDEANYTQCIANRSDTMMECFSSFEKESENWDISHLTQEQCSTLHGLRGCIKENLDVCSATDLMSIYDLFHNTLFRMTPCANFVAVPKVTHVDNNALTEA